MDGTWLNEPESWTVEGEEIALLTRHRSDFWRETAYGFVRDTGHFFAVPTAGAFTFQVRVQGAYEALYDQAGLMVRVDAENWVKAGLEWSDGRAMASSVLTVGRSDWATAPYGGDPGDFWVRATVTDGVLRLQLSSDGKTWPLLRLAPFPVSSSYQVGPMACSPERAGLRVRFLEARLTAPLGRALHDLT